MASASVMRSTAPPFRKAGHVGPLSGHAARITDLKTLSWASGAAHHRRGYLLVSSLPPEEHGIEGPVPQPPGGPLVGPTQPPVHLCHQGEGLIPQRVQDRAPVPVPGPGPLCPSRRLPLLPLCLRRWCRASPPPPAEAIRAVSVLSAGGGLAGAGVVGVGGG